MPSNVNGLGHAGSTISGELRGFRARPCRAAFAAAAAPRRAVVADPAAAFAVVAAVAAAFAAAETVPVDLAAACWAASGCCPGALAPGRFHSRTTARERCALRDPPRLV